MGEASREHRWLDLCLWAAPMALCLAIPGLGVVLAAAVIVVVLILRREARPGALMLWWRGPLASLALGVGVGLATYIVMGTLVGPALEHAFGAAPDVHALGAIKGHLFAYLKLMAVGLLFGGIFEELVFRGYTIGWGARLLGTRAALLLVLLSSAIFGFSHLYQGKEGVAETGFVGLVLGTTYVAAGRRLAPSAFAHMTIDAIGISELYAGGSFIHRLLAYLPWLHTGR